MFNTSKDKGTEKKMAHESYGNQPVINIISDGTEIKGHISTENDFRVSGKIDGELEVKGKCIVTQSGKISGELRANDADISGKTEGNLIIGNKLFLRQSAHVTGDIHTKTLLIEEGAIFEGVCHMSSDPLNIKNKSAGKSNVEHPPKTTAVNGKEEPYKPGFSLDQKRA